MAIALLGPAAANVAGQDVLETMDTAVAHSPVSTSRPREARFPIRELDPAAAAWVLIVLMGIVETAWCRETGMQLIQPSRIALSLGLLGAVSFGFGRWVRNPKVAQAAVYASLWVSFNFLLVLLSYLFAALRMPLWDSTFSRMDAALGFHWLTWYRVLQPHHLLHHALGVVYSSLIPQIVFSVSYFAYLRREDRNAEFLWTIMIAALTTITVSAMIPALGPHPDGHLMPWMESLVAVRAGAVTSDALGGLQGIVTMPSFHAVIAVLFVYANRPPLRSFYPMAVWNSVMLIALLPIGHHYLVDLIAGVLVALASIAAVRAASAICAHLAAAHDTAAVPGAPLEPEPVPVLDVAD